MSDDLVKRLRDRGVCSLEHNSCRNDMACDQAADRIEELEAKLAQAVDALGRIEDASQYFGNCPEASETTVRYAHETTRRLARTTLAELTGGKDDKT